MEYTLTTVVIATCLVWSPGVNSQIAQNSSECGSTKGCFSIPDGCNPVVAGSCQAFSSWSLTADNTSLLINLWANTSNYIALGFSNSGEMADSDVYACTLFEKVERSRNEASSRENKPQSTKGITNERVMFANGIASCSFERKLKDDDDTFFDLTSPNKYTPILAWGGQVDSDGRLNRHTGRGFGDTEVDFDGRGNGSGPSTKSNITVTFLMLLCFLLVSFIQ